MSFRSLGCSVYSTVKGEKAALYLETKYINWIIQKYVHNSRGTDSSCRKTPNIQIHWDRSLDKHCYQNKLLRSTSLTLEEEQTESKLLALEEGVEKWWSIRSGGYRYNESSELFLVCFPIWIQTMDSFFLFLQSQDKSLHSCLSVLQLQLSKEWWDCSLDLFPESPVSRVSSYCLINLSQEKGCSKQKEGSKWVSVWTGLSTHFTAISGGVGCPVCCYLRGQF